MYAGIIMSMAAAAIILRHLIMPLAGFSMFMRRVFCALFCKSLSKVTASAGCKTATVASDIKMPFTTTFDKSMPILNCMKHSAKNPPMVVRLLAKMGMADFLAPFSPLARGQQALPLLFVDVHVEYGVVHGYAQLQYSRRSKAQYAYRFVNQVKAHVDYYRRKQGYYQYYGLEIRRRSQKSTIDTAITPNSI